MKKPAEELIVGLLETKSVLKQEVYEMTLEKFRIFREVLSEVAESINSKVEGHKALKINYQEKGPFEADLTFGGDLLAFTMHTNTFKFDFDHFIYNAAYVKENRDRAFCGIIQIYNFLADSLRYHRQNDLGYLIGRIFVNKEGKFFVEGKRQLAFLYNDFGKEELTKAQMKNIIESAILYTLDFDLLTPPYEEVQLISVMEKMQQSGIMALKTGKRVGFKFSADSDDIK